MKIIFAWYDFYIGFYIDTYKGYLYFFPIPMFGIRLKVFYDFEEKWHRRYVKELIKGGLTKELAEENYEAIAIDGYYNENEDPVDCAREELTYYAADS